MILGLLLWFSLSLGLQEGNIGYTRVYHEIPPISLDLEIHAENEWIDIYGKYYNGMYLSPSRFRFQPVQDIFIVGVEVTYEHVSLIVETGCYHPVSVEPYTKLKGFWGGYSEIYVKFSSKKEW